MPRTPELPDREPAEDVPQEEFGDLEIANEETDAVKGGAVSSKLPSGRPIGS
jgi:hypothetical protein